MVPGGGFSAGFSGVGAAELDGAALDGAAVDEAASAGASSGTTRLHPPSRISSAKTRSLVSSPLLGIREKIPERSELGCLGDARAVFLVRGLLRVFLEGLQRELRFP